jgi:hypothetical protein
MAYPKGFRLWRARVSAPVEVERHAKQLGANQAAEPAISATAVPASAIQHQCAYASAAPVVIATIKTTTDATINRRFIMTTDPQPLRH